MPKHRSKHGRHAHLLEKAALAGWVVVIVAAFGLVAFYARLVLPSGQMAAVITSALVDLANKDRSEEDLGTLTVNPLLVAAAQAKADDMAEKGYFAHTSPDGSTSWSWFRSAGYSFSHAGENLAVDFTDSSDVERAWMNSPSHRANILNGTFTEVGIATAVGEYKGRKTIFVVQMFGTPATKVAEATPVKEVVPENPLEIALASAGPQADKGAPSVLGSEAGSREGKAAAAIVPGAEPQAKAAQPDAEGLPVVAAMSAVPEPEVLATSPRTFLRAVYFIAGVLLLLLIGLITRLELRRHHVQHVVAAGLLFVLMSGALFVADRYLFPAPTVGQELARGAP